MKFVCVQDGLYCINLNGDGRHTNYLTTGLEPQDHFSDIDNNKADLARYIQEYLCLPSDIDFSGVIEKGEIKECGVDRRHRKITNIIFGPAKAAIEGRLFRERTRC